MKKAVCWILLAGLLFNPGVAFSIEVVIKGPYEAKTRVGMGPIEGVIVAAKPDGVYVKVAKEDVKLGKYVDPEVLGFVERYRDKEWDQDHLLLFIPKAVLEAKSETNPEPAESAASGEPKTAVSEMDCYFQGKRQAESLSTAGSTMGGFAGGFFLGILGTVLAVVAQGEPSTPFYLLPEEKECKLPFVQGYQERGKSRKKTAALTGGVVGTLALVVVLVAASSGN